MCQKIVDTYEAGNTSIRKVAERFPVSKSTVKALLKRKKETGKLLPSQAKGGKPSLLFGHEQQIEEMRERVTFAMSKSAQGVTRGLQIR